jgi:glycosyltransferase involved in cell wall biosynthesis
MAGPTVEFLGYVPDNDLPELMARCKAFLFPGLEDFGITPVQAQAAGRPVIAYGGGGALDTVIPGETGELYHEMTVESLIELLESFDASVYNPDKIRRHAARFDKGVFKAQIMSYIDQAYAAFSQNTSFIWRVPAGLGAKFED